MDSNDWIVCCIMILPVLASVFFRLQYEKDNREWAERHAPLSDEVVCNRLDAALLAAEEGARECSSCGFQNFRSKISCAMCGKGPSSCHKRCLGPVSAASAPPRLQNRSERIRNIVEGNLSQNRESTETAQRWPSAVVRFRRGEVEGNAIEKSRVEGLPAVAASLSEEIEASTVAYEDSAAADPLNKQDFPTRVASFTTQALARAATIAEVSATSPILLHIDRGDGFLTQSIEALATMTPAQAIAAIRVSFIGEPAIDAGGVYREWVSLMSESIAKPEAGVFRCVNDHDQSYHMNPHSREILGDRHLAHVLAAGRLVGRALLDGNTLGFHLSRPLLKLVLGHPIGFDDLQFFDPELYKSLQWLVQSDGVDALDLDFTVCENIPGQAARVVELVPGGSSISVTDSNKLLYIDRMTKYRLVESVSGQLYAFLKGVHEIVPQELLALFDVDELDYLLCGSDEIDVDDWERHTRYTQDLWHHPTRQWFWEMVREMPVEYQRRLLHFATGSSRAPLSGFAALTSYDGRLSPFTLVGRPLTDEGFVRSHSCFNRLVVPLCVNRNHLKRGLYALLDTDAYGFSMV